MVIESSTAVALSMPCVSSDILYDHQIYFQGELKKLSYLISKVEQVCMHLEMTYLSFDGVPDLGCNVVEDLTSYDLYLIMSSLGPGTFAMLRLHIGFDSR